ncbi:MAG TPA: PPC domain-containing protein, partial [Thermoanaerobaculia bacterium]|nr:PPC domain-containing protein [Thermoanaerobaculia bacterium]
DADVFVDRAWIQSVAGADLHRTDCGSLPFAGEPGGDYLFGSGSLSQGNPDVGFNFEVQPGIGLLIVSLNGSLGEVNADLFLRRGSPPTLASFDCSSTSPLALEVCGLPNPQPETWHILAHRSGSGAGPFQVTATLFGAGAGNGDPPPPPGPWLFSAALPGFEAKVLINNSTLGNRETDCISETLCVSGALAGRPEIFVKVIGPRPNGFLWSQLTRFTPSKVEVWLRKISTGQVNYYELAAVGPAEDNVSGLQDREAFSP